jgi:hypothetical protein
VGGERRAGVDHGAQRIGSPFRAAPPTVACRWVAGGDRPHTFAPHWTDYAAIVRNQSRTVDIVGGAF